MGRTNTDEETGMSGYRYRQTRPRGRFDKCEPGQHVAITVKATREVVMGEVTAVGDAGVTIRRDVLTFGRGYVSTESTIPWSNQTRREVI
jgi:hypothetical protein